MLTLQSWEVEGSLPKALKPSPRVKSLLQQGRILYDAFLHLARSFLREPSGRWLRRNVGSLVALKTAYAYLLAALEEEGATVVRATEPGDPFISDVRRLDEIIKRKGLLDFALEIGLDEEYWKDLEETTAIVSFLLNVILAIKRGRVRATRKTYRKVRKLAGKYLNRVIDFWADIEMLKEIKEDSERELVDIEEVEREIAEILAEHESKGN